MVIITSKDAKPLDDVLNTAIKEGILPEGSTVKSLDYTAKKDVIDSYVLRDAINLGYLPKGSTLEDLTGSIIQKMQKDGNYTSYCVDGSVFKLK